MGCASGTSRVLRYGSHFLTGVRLRLTLAGVPPSWFQAQVAAQVPAFANALRVFQRQQECQRDQHAHSFHLFSTDLQQIVC